MSEPIGEVRSRWGERIRSLLMVGIVLMVGLILWKAPWSGGDRYVMKQAYGNALGAAPGALALMLPSGAQNDSVQNTKIYIVDTSKQVICTYAFRNDKLRLVSAREYSKDMDIMDASDRVPTPDGRGTINPPEGNNGFDRDTAAAYAEGQKTLVDKSEKKR